MTSSALIPCPTCAGTGWSTHEDRHTRTRQDACEPCKGTGKIDARTGTVREASFDPATGRAFSEAAGRPLSFASERPR